jgi:hypothetical protein
VTTDKSGSPQKNRPTTEKPPRADAGIFSAAVATVQSQNPNVCGSKDLRHVFYRSCKSGAERAGGRRHNADSVADRSGRPSILQEAFVKRAVLVGVFAAVMATAWTFLAAQQGQSLDFKAPNPPPRPTLGPEQPGPPVAVPPASSKTPQPAVVDPGTVESPPASPLSPLQQRFIELSAKKARSLNPEQLQKAINELDQEVIELNAWSKVEEGARILRDVAEKSPQTRAGRAAKAALQIIDQNHSRENMVPRPDDAGAIGRHHEKEKFSPESDSKATPGPQVDTRDERPFDVR